MPILVTCNRCMQQSQVPDEYAGKKIRCRSCSNVMLVTPNTPESLPPVAPLAGPAPAPMPGAYGGGKPPRSSSFNPKYLILAVAVIGAAAVVGLVAWLGVSWMLFPSYRTIVARTVSTTNSLADALENVTDHDSAKSNKGKIERLLNKLVALRERHDKLMEGEKLTRKERDKIEADYRPELEKAATRMRDQMKRIGSDSLAAQELRPVFAEFSDKMLEISSEKAKRELDEWAERNKAIRDKAVEQASQRQPPRVPGPPSVPRPPRGGPRFGPSRVPPPRIAGGDQIRRQMENRWGANRIVYVKLTSGLIETGKRMREIQKEVQGKGASSSRGSGSIFVIGPVDDFNRFVQLIDFGTVTRSDEATRTIEVNVTPNYQHTPR